MCFQSETVSQKLFVPCEVNFNAGYKFGNIRKQGINICHWNKGSGYMFNKIEEIEYLVSSFKPHILGISEANFWRHQSLQNVQLENYDLYFAKSLDNPKHNVSRVAVYVNT